VDFNNNQKHSLLSKMGYSGPSEGPAMEAFIRSNPGVAARMGKFTKALQTRVTADGRITAFAEGGAVSAPRYEAAGYQPPTGPSKDKRPKAKDTTTGQFKIGPKGKDLANYVAELNAQATPATTPDTTPATTPATDATTPATDATTTPTAAPTVSPGQVLTDAVIQNPADLTVQADVKNIGANKSGTVIEGSAGQVTDATTADVVTSADTSTAAQPTEIAAETVQPVTIAEDVSAAVSGVTGEQGQVSPESLATAAQQTTSSISDMQAAQGTAYLMDNPVQRELQAGEIISGSAVDASKVNQLMETVEAAQATPSEKATVQGQLSNLMKDFEGGNTPAWAAGAMRNAQSMLAQRGLGASSMAGQAVIQAAMESALPIAQADASTFAQFEAQNLSNRQQTALFAAQQRADFLKQDFDQKFQTRVLNAAKVSDIANMNFTAEQNIAMENSRAVNTMNLANLDARQAMVMAKAAALSQLDMANLDNRQQAAVQNAQAFLQMDMANLDNAQQATMFRAQSQVQALFTDQAATNAALQFNAASKNQTNQFFADLSTRVNMFNTEQQNAINQFNAGEKNAGERFNAQLEAQRKQFNANSSLVIQQANAQWRQNVVTANTAAQNESNMQMAQASNNLTMKAMDEIWQKERDTLAYAFTALMSEQDRAQQLLMADKAEAAGESAAKSATWMKLISAVLGI
jgi:hypothetical protein